MLRIHLVRKGYILNENYILCLGCPLLTPFEHARSVHAAIGAALDIICAIDWVVSNSSGFNQIRSVISTGDTA